MALTGDERRLISEANMHLPGRQVDPEQVSRDLWRLSEWERQRSARERRAGHGSRPGAVSADQDGFDLKHRSRALTEGPERAAARTYLKGIGYDDEALRKPIIGVASTWIETMPCNFHLRALAAKVKEGIRAAGGTPMEFNTIAISDGITMGTSGMKTSLVSREVIADSIELTARGHLFDAVVALSGCDKTIPGTVMALARLDIPSVMLYGGSIPPGHFQGHDVTILDVFEAVGERRRRQDDDEELNELESVATPGAGACGGQFTANTMAMAFEMMGISADGPLRRARPGRDQGPGRLRRRRARHGRAQARPAPAATSSPGDSIENAIAAITASGGSTNGVLHLLAVAHEMGVELDIDDFDRISESTPLICDLSPGGRYNAVDMYRAGGTAVLAKRLDELGVLHRDTPTVLGPTVGELADASVETDGQVVILPLDQPLKATGGLAILRGNLAPEGCVVKLAGHERRQHTGPARVFEDEAARDGGRHPPHAQRGRHRRDPQRGPGRWPRHARDARRHRRHQRRWAWATASRSSPTAASPAPPMASRSATSRPRRTRAARSPPCARAT